METPNPYEHAADLLRQARTALAAQGAHVRALSTSGSPHARATAETARKRLERMRGRLRTTLADLEALEGELTVAQDWHDRYARVQRT